MAIRTILKFTAGAKYTAVVQGFYTGTSLGVKRIAGRQDAQSKTTDSRCIQSCIPQPLKLQCKIVSSEPLHTTSSIQIKSFAWCTKGASGSTLVLCLAMLMHLVSDMQQCIPLLPIHHRTPFPSDYCEAHVVFQLAYLLENLTPASALAV